MVQRYEVQTNRHPNLQGQAWGWIRDRETGKDIEFWHGSEGYLKAYERMYALNAAAAESVQS